MAHTVLGDNCVIGAEDRLVSGLGVILNLGGEKLTNTEVVDAIKFIQQRTKRKRSSQDVFKFQDVSIYYYYYGIRFHYFICIHCRLHPGIIIHTPREYNQSCNGIKAFSISCKICAVPNNAIF